MTSLGDVRFKHLNDYSKEEHNEEDDDLGSVLSDYNGIFYDAPTIENDYENKHEMSSLDKKAKASSIESSIDSLFEETNKIDEDLRSVDEEDFDSVSSNKSEAQDDEASNETINNISNSKTKTFSNNNIYIPVENEQNDQDYNDEKINLDIEKEFEDYLNDENNDANDLNIDTQNDENKRQRYAKLRKLENMEFTYENYEILRQMGVDKYGFINKKYRRKAWPLLIMYKNNSNENLNSSFTKKSNTSKIISEKKIKKNKYFNQVTLDVVRTLKRFPPEISDKLRLRLQNQLIDLICRILVRHENLHYYQGYHDICLTFLLVVGVEDSLPLLENVTLSHLTLTTPLNFTWALIADRFLNNIMNLYFRCFMETTMESTLKLLFNIMPLIDKKNPRVSEHIQKAELGVIFCLSWLITWYSHVMENLKIILRLYDFFISTDPLMPIYLGAVIVNEHAEEILSIDCDMASLHTVISKYPTKIEDIEILEKHILESINLYKQYPPEKLSDLNLKWLEKCQKIQEEMILQQKAEQALRNRKSKRLNSGNESSDESSDISLSEPGTDNYNVNTSLKQRNKIAKRNKLALTRVKSKNIANRLLVGLTFSVGVAAVAMYALNNSVRDSPQEFISKVYQFLPYKMF